MLIFSASFLITLRKAEKHSPVYFSLQNLLPSFLCNVWPSPPQPVSRGSSPRGGPADQLPVRGELHPRQSGGREEVRGGQPVPALPVPVPPGAPRHGAEQQAVRGLGQDLPLPPQPGAGQADPPGPGQGLLAGLLGVLPDSLGDLVQSQDWATAIPPLRRTTGGNALPLQWGGVLLLPGSSPPPHTWVYIWQLPPHREI